MTGQNVQNNSCRMNIMFQRFRAGSVHSIQPVSQHGAQYVDNLPVTAWLLLQFPLHAPDSWG